KGIGLYSLITAVPVTVNGEYRGCAILRYSLAEIRSRALFLVVRNIIVAVLLTISVMFLISLAVRRSLTPLHELVRHVDSLNKNKEAAHLSLNTGDEIERLAESLNALSDNWKHLLSERDERNEESEAQRRFIELVIQNIASGIIIINSDGKIIGINKSAQEKLGFADQKIEGSFFASVFPELEGTDSSEQIGRTLSTGEAYTNERVSLHSSLSPEKSIIVNISIRAITEKPGTILGAVVLIDFIQEKIQLEEHLLKVNEELKRANVVKSEFLSMVSHELRTPLTLVKMYSSMMSEKKLGPLTEKQEKAIEVMNRRSQHLGAMIDDLLNLSRMEAGRTELDLKAISPTYFLEEAEAVFRPRAESKGLIFDVSYEKHLPAVTADKEKLMQVLNNLVENALKFTDEGHIGVSAEIRSDNPELVQFTVSDTGGGIPEYAKQKIFEKFYQVDTSDTRRHGGTGLGLAIAREIVMQHGGEILLASSGENEGSVFRFTVPLHKIDATGTALDQTSPRSESRNGEAGAAVSPPAPGAINVLLVDDDPDFLEMMTELLVECGFGVQPVKSGVEAIAELLSDKKFDIVLLDVSMHKLTGYEVCKAIKMFDATRHIPVLMLTAAGQSEQIARGFESGASGYLVKPFELDDLLLTLNRILMEVSA
ncbi:MAG TPA: ATP-binding protein, partial [bacterium]|nr:ATP-binding protein [bacterium]